MTTTSAIIPILRHIPYLRQGLTVIKQLYQKMKSPTLSTAPNGVERMGLASEAADHRSARSRRRRS